MNDYLPYAFGLLAAYIGYTVISSFISSRYHARRAAELGCKPAFQRPYRYPFGIDMALDIMEADKNQIVPNWLLDLYRGMGEKPTWEQNFLGTPNYATADPKNIQALLATQFNDFVIGDMRRNNFMPMLGNGIFTSDGKSWEHSRALLRPQFAREQVSDLELEETHVQDMMKHLGTTTSSDGNRWTESVDLSPLFFRLTLDSATEFLFGESVHSQIDALPGGGGQKEEVSLNWRAFGPAFDGGTMNLGVRGRLSQMYWVWSPPSFRRQCKLVHEFADYYVHRALAKVRAEEEGKQVGKGQRKEKYVFLDELTKSTRDPIELRTQLLNILLAGRDTTAGLLGFTLYVLARNPAVYVKLRQIILDQFGDYENPKDITFAGLKSCTHLQHTLSEILRLWPTVPLNARRAVRDTTLPRGGGPDGLSPIYVKKGCEVNYVVHVMHRRKDIWGPDADEFRPERWEGRKTGWEFLPFNGGPRICLGQQFALTEAGYVIVRLLQRFGGIECTDPAGRDGVVRHQYSVTTSPREVLVRMRED